MTLTAFVVKNTYHPIHLYIRLYINPSSMCLFNNTHDRKMHFNRHPIQFYHNTPYQDSTKQTYAQTRKNKDLNTVIQIVSSGSRNDSRCKTGLVSCGAIYYNVYFIYQTDDVCACGSG